MKGIFLETVFIFLFVFTGIFFAVTALAETPLIPREALFGNPEKVLPQISPDGKKISYLAPFEGVLNIWVRTVGRQDGRPVTCDKGRGIRTYFWAHDSRHILYLQDTGGDENWHLYRVDLATLATKNYTPFKGVQARIVGGNKHVPDKLLIAMNKDDKSLHDVYSLDLPTGDIRRVAKNPGDISEWLADWRLEIRGAVRTRPDGGEDFLVRKDGSAPWRKLTGWDLADGMANGPLGFTKDGSAVYLEDSSDSDKSRLKKVDLERKKSEVLASDAEYDLGGVQFDPETYEPQIVSFEKDRLDHVVLDPSLKEDMERLQRLDPGDLSITSRDDADRRWVVAYGSDRSATSYYFYDRKMKKAEFLFKSRTTLDAYTLAPMEPVQFKARDGFVIHGYLTFPPGKERMHLPMVLNVHGGPWARDSWGYNAQAQWLANRGYLCLEVNFRGSTGYGKNFVNAADKEWGGAMQNDLTDAVHWAVQKGYADPGRVAIYGGSYGGYAALAGAALTPDLFRCAVDVVGPSNLLTFLKTIPPYWKLYQLEFYRRVGNPETEEAMLRSRSPLFHVDQIKIPIFIAQGANDPRVSRRESEQIVAALEKKGIDHEYLLFPDEGHGFARPENRLKFYAACEKFLARHLGGRFEDAK